LACLPRCHDDGGGDGSGDDANAVVSDAAALQKMPSIH
jgi:hypothetical protein